jgi:serine/threonine protein kinase
MNTGELIAVKSILMSGNRFNVKKKVKEIKKEIQMLKTLQHTNIVKYLDTQINETRNGVDIVLEYVPGGSIRSLIDKFGSFEEKLVKIYTRQMVEGLVYLHSNRIIHRDMKCANVLVDNDGRIKLTDFGCSKKIEEQLKN